MKTVLNNDCTISITLEADECAEIARGLHVAVSETCLESTLVWRVLARSFETSALALETWAELPPAAQRAVTQEDEQPHGRVVWKSGRVVWQG